MKIRIYAGEKLSGLADNQPWIDLNVEPDDIEIGRAHV